MELRRRTIAKTFSWRVFSVIITTVLAYTMTGELEFAATLGVIDTAIKLVVFYAHERVWVNVAFGRVKPPDYEI